MIKRFGKREGIYSVIPPAVIYGSAAFTICYAMWPYFYYVKSETIIVLGVFAIWRYGWQVINYIRATIYARLYYPKLKRRVAALPEQHRYPERIYFIIPSYKEEPWVSVETFQSIMSNLAEIPCHATLVVAVGADRDETLINALYCAHPSRDKVELVFQRQEHGKRIAMGHGLRAVARRYQDEPNSVTIFMDGDSWLEPGALRKTIPFFVAFSDLGALTTNEIAYINTQSRWYKDWFNLKFGQRHILFQSHSLSDKVLTLTGRFSLVRTSIVVKEDFIRHVEHDMISHWMHGRFRFLMGDDKSTWFYLLKHRWKMLYIPDVICYSLESRDISFFTISLSLPYRWYGNTMRNNARALALGSRCTGLFIWLAILDQRLSMWTSLVGLFGALVLTIMKSFVYLPFYFAWVVLVRIGQMVMIAFRGHPVSMRTIPLMLYNQWIGAFVKIRAFFYLADQSWAKGRAIQQTQGQAVIKHPLARYMPAYTMALSYGLFAITLLVAEKALSVPGIQFFSPQKEVHVIDARAYGVIADDDHDDALALQTILDRLDGSGAVRITLPAGQLNFDQSVSIHRNNLTLAGQGRRETRIVSSLRVPAGAVLAVEGAEGPQIGVLAERMSPDAKSFKLNQDAELRPGDYVLIKMPNDTDFFRQIGSQAWQRPFPFLRQSIVKVTAIEQNRITFDVPTGIKFSALKTTVHRVQPVEGVILQDFTIEQRTPGGSAEEVRHRYENLYPDYAVDSIALNLSADIVLVRLAILNAGRHPISIENSFGFLVRDCEINGAWNKGDKGHGYLRIARSYHGLVTECDIRNIRHITLQWSAAYNRLQNLYTEVDINFHGGYSHHNTVENVTSKIPERHPWPPVFRTPLDAAWASPDGPGNTFTAKDTNPQSSPALLGR